MMGMNATELLILDNLFDTLPSGMVVFDTAGKILRMNRRAKETLGLDLDENPIDLDHLPIYLSPLSRQLKNADADIHRGELALSLPTHEDEATIGFSLKILTTPDGTPIKTLTFTDITQVLKDRLAMDKIKDELNQSKKLASIGTMIAGVAHELNNPLTGISMSASLVRMNLERMKKQPTVAQDQQLIGNLDKALAEMSKIIRANEKAADLVSDLLAYSKPSQLYLMPKSLSELIHETVGALKSDPRFSQFTLTIEGDTDRQILCDRIKLDQVFYNLFKNACDATEGKGNIKIWWSETTEGGKPFVITHVKDNGPGIDKTVINRIFDPFFTTKGHSGVGLGLSISYRTIEQHGGMLSVDSVKWEGTEFKVALPIHLENDPEKNQP